MVRKKEKEVVNKIIEELRKRGFNVNRYYAKTTKSIYLKLDYGVCGGIRISDHCGIKKYRYRFNLLKNYMGKRVINDRGYVRLYYNYNDIKDLIYDVEQARNFKLAEYGILKYRSFMYINSQNKLYKKFKKVA